MKAQELIEKYGLAANTYIEGDENVYEKRRTEVAKLIDEWPEKGYPPAEAFINPEYRILTSKWQDYVADGSSGFNINPVCPNVWYKVLDEFLSYVKDECPKFRISKIKIVSGALCIFLFNISEEVQQELEELQAVLFDKKLKY